ncbi:hypothetical protein NDU88_005438 [Pleurodeles waltl]|uniref:Uncharacterized protein n=1 Tax=Pleurodeles waltl TaxID=8319 RepID=A0AAV7L182_PLEWA|nr:hypothetical protein NDU88_005438 [Pleurodeles waltl]
MMALRRLKGLIPSWRSRSFSPLGTDPPTGAQAAQCRDHPLPPAAHSAWRELVRPWAFSAIGSGDATSHAQPMPQSLYPDGLRPRQHSA